MTEPDLQQKIDAFSELGNEMRQAAGLLNRDHARDGEGSGGGGHSGGDDHSGGGDGSGGGGLDAGGGLDDVGGVGGLDDVGGGGGLDDVGGGENYQFKGHNPGVQSLLDGVEESRAHNPWFTIRETSRALDALGRMLQKDKLEAWAGRYEKQLQEARVPKTVAVIMAGNIPLVGFHDFMCVLMAGHRFLGKLSSQDPVLPVTVARMLTRHAPGLEKFIEFTSGQIDSADAEAVIATGSDNTARYFEFRFGDKPRIIRKNRNSSAVLSGREPEAVLRALGEDVFSYFGLGCRSISHLLIPEDFDLSRLVEAWVPFRPITSHPKYRNNLIYQRALFNLKDQPFTDAGCCLLAENAQTASPVSVVHYSRYRNFSDAGAFLMAKQDQLQCVVAAGNFLPDNAKTLLPGAETPPTGAETTPAGRGTTQAGGATSLPGPETTLPGESQQPGPGDYADGVDTMDFLLRLP